MFYIIFCISLWNDSLFNVSLQHTKSKKGLNAENCFTFINKFVFESVNTLHWSWRLHFYHLLQSKTHKRSLFVSLELLLWSHWQGPFLCRNTIVAISCRNLSFFGKIRRIYANVVALMSKLKGGARTLDADSFPLLKIFSK